MAKKKMKKTPKPTERLQARWREGLEALSSAESEARRLLAVVKKKGPSDAQKALGSLATRLGKERRRAEKELRSRARALQARIESERKILVRLVHEAIQGTLATLNIPSRAEIVALTRKVDELSRKVRAK